MNVTATKTAGKQASSSPPPAEQKKKPKSKYAVHAPTRETVESIVVAFILAFLFRTFEAEPFVIPTGSMAETLNGRHKEVDCAQCGWDYHIGASREVTGDSGIVNPHQRIRSSVCPNCRYVNDIWDAPVYQGDRIIVNKFPYEFGDPKRWDVIVFKNPEEPMRNFIKRLVGLPNEYLRIEGGDIYARKDEKAEWKILRKEDPYKQLLMQMIVYDNDHPERKLIENGWPERWAATSPQDAFEADPSGWKQPSESRSFVLEQTSAEPKWLRYRHYVPNDDDWNAIFQDPPLPFDGKPAPQLINDFCGYNEIVPGPYNAIPAYWVGDLTVRFEIDVREATEQSELKIVLTKGIRDYRCTIDLKSGEATLAYYDRAFDRDQTVATASTSMRGADSYSVAFANVDNRLCLWIDGDLVLFKNEGDVNRGGEYDAPATTVPTNDDLAPVGISLQGAAAEISHLKLERDIYYRPEQESWMKEERRLDRNRGFENQSFVRPQELLFALDEPERYAELYLKHEHWVEFPPLKDDEFFVLGDNSPASLDSRLWKHTHAVPRHNLLGKAFFIYWPHGVPFLNGGEGYPITYHQQSGGGEQEKYPKLRAPFYPNFKRMERIR